MLAFVRRVVSGQKKRFQDGPDGFDLDLAYISPRIIAMGLPAQGKDVLYRNPMQEIARFLQTYHRGHAKVYNLCSEHTYSPEHLSVAFQQLPHDDHQVPALAVVQQFCADAHAWLAADPANVVVVHCKAGKGRTGIMICCLMLYLHKNAPDLANLAPAAAAAAAEAAAATVGCGSAPDGLHMLTWAPPAAEPGTAGSGHHQPRHSQCWHPWQFVPPLQLQHLEQPVRDILDTYAERRTHDGNGVTIKSQRRWVGYFWAVLCNGPSLPVGLLPKPRAVQLRQVTISGLAPGTAESCVLVVETRVSGSVAPRASRVWARAAPRAGAGGVAGLCMAPCMQPWVEDDSCSISTTPAGDTLTFKMPAASMGLSTMQQQQHSIVPVEAAGAAGAPGVAAGAPDGACGAGMFSCCSCCQASASSGCICSVGAEGLPGGVPSTAQPSSQAADAVAFGPGGAAAAAHAASSVPSVDESWEVPEQAGCCVVEGDVRLVVLKGSTRLFYTWLNTAFLPFSGSYSLTRAQLDKPVKSLPPAVSLAVRFVDMQPTADVDDMSGVGQPGREQELPKPWTFGLADPPLETTAKPAGKGSKSRKQPHGRTVSMLADAAGGARPVSKSNSQGSTAADNASGLSPGAQRPLVRCCSADGSAASALVQASATCSVHVVGAGGSADQQVLNSSHDTVTQQLRGVQHSGNSFSSNSVSAPNSPQAPKLRSSGSWRQHLPVISSISSSALLWGPAGDTSGRKSADSSNSRVGTSPSPWCGTAAFSWDWDALVAADDMHVPPAAADAGRTSSAAAAAAAAQRAHRAAHPHAPARTGPGGTLQAKPLSPGTVNHRRHQQQQQQQHRSAQVQGGSQRGQQNSGSADGTSVSQDLHSNSCGVSTGQGQASIELPMIVKRPSGVDSLVDALLDPEHSPATQPTAVAAAAAAAAGLVLASEASSIAVAGRGTAGYHPPGQLRKGYSWHGSSSWFAAMTGGSNTAAGLAASSNTPAGPSPQRQQQQQRFSGGSSSSRRNAAGTQEEEQQQEHYVAADAAAFAADFDPVLLSEQSGEAPGAVLSSCDPLQGLLEALNWSTDVQRYEPRDQQQHGSSSSSHKRHGLSTRRLSTGSEPCSPKHCKSALHTVHSSPLLAHASKSAPATPAAGYSHTAAGSDVQQHMQSPAVKARSVVTATGLHASRAAGSRPVDRQRPRVLRPDLCRLLDLEDWAEAEDEGLDTAAATPASDAGLHRGGGDSGGVAAAATGRHGLSSSSSSHRVQPHEGADAAAAADVDVANRTRQQQRRAQGFVNKHASAAGRAVSTGGSRRQAACDEAMQGLLAAEGSRVTPSYSSEEGPAAVQQWQQLEKAWQKKWWV